MNTFALVDCNNFYVSCERLFNPSLEGRPVIALSNNDGCVIARSQEAKKLGIEMGAPHFQIKALCKLHGVVICSSNYSLYGDLSQRVMTILNEMAEEVEIYSIDEAFIKFPAHMTEEAIIKKCHQIRKTIKKWIGLPVSVGLGSSKTLAKLANDHAKKAPSGVFDLRPPLVNESILKKTPVKDIWGVGRSTRTQLHTLAIFTAWDFTQADAPLIRRKMGVVGERMLRELQGTSCLTLNQHHASKQSITFSRSFGHSINTIEEMSQALATYVNGACLKLRSQNSKAQALSIFLETTFEKELDGRRSFTTTIPLDHPSNDTSEMISAAKKGLKLLFRKDTNYKKCGVILLDITNQKIENYDLFANNKPRIRREKLTHTLDLINANFGKNTIFYGAMGINNGWVMRSDKRSPGYTTSWDELAIARA